MSMDQVCESMSHLAIQGAEGGLGRGREGE